MHKKYLVSKQPQHLAWHHSGIKKCLSVPSASYHSTSCTSTVGINRGIHGFLLGLAQRYWMTRGTLSLASKLNSKQRLRIRMPLLMALIAACLTHVLHLAQQQYKSIYKLDRSQQMAPPNHQALNPTQLPLLPRKSLGKQIGKIPKYTHTHYSYVSSCACMCIYRHTFKSLYV